MNFFQAGFSRLTDRDVETTMAAGVCQLKFAEFSDFFYARRPKFSRWEGIRYHVSGCWFLVTGLWSLVTGLWSLVTGFWLLVVGEKR